MATFSQTPLFNVAHPSLRPGLLYTSYSKANFSHRFKLSEVISQPRPLCQLIQQASRPSAVLETVDYTVTIQTTSLIPPMEETERKFMFLSNIDKTLNFKTSTILFFSRNPKFPFETIVAKLKKAYRKIFLHYDFLTGRLRWNTAEGRPEIDCNAAGAGFVVASSDMFLEELQYTAFPNHACQQFAVRKWNASPEDQPLCVMQVTSLRCGGFAIGFSLNHVTVDGISCKIFLENLASLVADSDLVLTPYNNRHLLAARSPPHVAFPHPELFNFENLRGMKSNVMPLRATFQKLHSKYFQLSRDDIISLKQKAGTGSAGYIACATGFNVVAAHIWQCVAQAKNPENNPDKSSRILFAVNIRSRLRPRLPSSYAGNAIFTGNATTTSAEIKNRHFSHLVQLVSQGDARMTDEYVKSVIDWLELHKGFPYGDALISSWWNLGLHEVEFPWGKPKWSCPVVPNHGNNAITLIPEVEGKTFKQLQVLVSLPEKEMKTFQGLFHELI